MSASLYETLEPYLAGLFDAASGLSDSGSVVSIQSFCHQVAELREQAQTHGLRGISHICMLLDRGLQRVLDEQRALAPQELEQLAAWPMKLMSEVFGAGIDEDQIPKWEVLNDLRTQTWFPQMPEHFVGLIESWLGEDAQRVSAPDSLFGSIAASKGVDYEDAFAPTQLMEYGSDEDFTSLHAQSQPLVSVAVPTETYIGHELLLGDDLLLTQESDMNTLQEIAAASEITNDELMMMQEAFSALQDEFSASLRSSLSHEQLNALLSQYAEHGDNILNATVHLGMNGFQHIIETVQINTVMLQMSPEMRTATHTAMLADWPVHALTYLRAPNDESSLHALIGFVTHHEWPHPVTPEVAAQWAELLASVNVIETRIDANRATHALPEHMDITVPADIDRQVLNSLLMELPQHAQQFSALVQNLSQGGTLDDMDRARRVAHTLKGAGNTVGVKGVGNLTHALEDILVACGRAQRLPTPVLCDTLMEAADCLQEMSEALLNEGAGPADSVAVYQKVLDWANRIDREGLPEEDDSDHVLHEADELVKQVADNTSSVMPANAPATDATETVEDTETYLRVPASLIDSLLKLAGENSIITSQIQDRVVRLTEDLNAQRTGSRQIRQLSSELEQLVDVRGMAMLGDGTGELDALEMDQYNELHMLSRRIVESSADSREFSQALEREVASLRDLMAAKERVQLEIQRSIQRTRMVEINSIAPRLQRTVRQAARVLDRSVQLVIRGESTLVDTQLLNRIVDPLMHMLRNAVDHGIEPTDVRLASGKPATGTITLSFSAVGSNIKLRCEDDGRGLNLDSIRDKAIGAGLIKPDDVLSDVQMMRLILLPGFSTREQANLISGRGIGMDVVHRAVLDLRGTLELQSDSGAGAYFDMSLPVQLSATQVLISRSSRHLLAISQRSVEQILPLGNDLIVQPDGSYRFNLQGKLIPAIRLESLLGLHELALAQAGLLQVVMVVFDEHRQRQAIIVPELSDSRNVVVKPFSALVPRTIGVDGATILGDGSVAPVVDLPDLIRAYRAEGSAISAQATLAVESKLPLCLIVDDSVSVRRTMEQLMQDSGYEVVSARDGIDALGVVQQRVPDVALVDLEMPRMNGLQLTSALRSQAATKTMPVIMITSRFTNKHRQLAEEAGVNAFLTKPYADEQLLRVVEELLESRQQAASQDMPLAA
jgi:chemotaxis protein histidine kinase CheA